MKNYNFRKAEKNLKVISSSLFASTIMLTTMAGCTKDNSVGSDVISTPTITSTIESDITDSTDTTITIETLPLESYAFSWEADENYDFEQFITEKYGIDLGTYIWCLGFTDELNIDFTNFINDRFNTDYEVVPFKKANYFYTYIKNSNNHDFYDEYDSFRRLALNNSNNFTRGAFDSKFILSYLEQNNIPFGYPVPFENMKALVGDSVYTCDLTKEYYDDHEFGNYDDSYVYSCEEIVTLLKNYNRKVRTLASDKGIKTLTIEDNLDVCDVWNSHLVEFFGSDAPKFGEYLTKDQIIKLKGGYCDLSNVDGAIYKGGAQVKGSARVDYTDRLDNYTLYNYDDSYYTVEEEQPSGRTR